MAAKYLMQAQSDADGLLHAWRADRPDWLGASWTTAGNPGNPLDIALSGGGFVMPEDVPDNALVNNNGDVLVNAGGAILLSDRASLVNAGAASLINASGATLLVGT